MILSFSIPEMRPYVEAGIRQARGEDVGTARVKRQTIRLRGPRIEMVADGFAVKRQYKLIPGSVFHMTLDGARLALRDGEGLRNANYPQAGDV